MKPLKYKNLYNQDFKRFFLDKVQAEYSENTYLVYERFLRKVAPHEEYKKKDLYDFDYNDILDLLNFINAKSENIVANYVSMIRKYLLFSISENASMGNIPMTELITSEIMKKIVDRSAKESRLITRSELYDEILPTLLNDQDRAMFALMFEGVRKEELPLIKVEDIDFESRELSVSNRKISLDYRLSGILKNAIHEDVYIKYQEKVDEKDTYNFKRLTHENKDKPNAEMLLLISDSVYLFKQIHYNNGKTNGFTPLSNNTLQRRLLRIVKKKNICDGFLNNTTLYNSGIADRLIKYEMKVGRELTHKEIEDFCIENNEKVNSFYIKNIYNFIRNSKKAE